MHDAIGKLSPGNKLFYSVPTCWNSKYDAVSHLLKFSDVLNHIFEIASIAKLKQTDLDFLKEYVKVFQLVAILLKELQRDENCFYGMFLSKLIKTRLTLSKIVAENLQYCLLIINALITGISSRYSDMLNFEPNAKTAIFAAVTHSKYKVKFVPPEKCDMVSQMLIDAVIRYAHQISHNQYERDGLTSDDDYGYDETVVLARSVNANQAEVLNTSITNSANSARLQLVIFLADSDSSIESVDQCDIIKHIFLQYYMSVPSPAPSRVSQH